MPSLVAYEYGAGSSVAEVALSLMGMGVVAEVALSLMGMGVVAEVALSLMGMGVVAEVRSQETEMNDTVDRRRPRIGCGF